MFFRSERLFLRPVWPEDWAELHPLINDAEIIRNLACAPWPYAAEDAQAFANIGQDSMLPHFLLTLPSATGSAIVGCAGLSENSGQVELGYWIARSHWGNGFATEAARAVLEIAQLLGHSRIVAGHFYDNPASGRVLRKAGFAPTGPVCKRHSLGRGEDVRSIAHAIELGESRSRYGGEDDGLTVCMAA